MSSDYILKDLSFCIKKGQKIAIVGENGAGKSTLAKCLLGLYKPTSGKITVDNVEIQDIDEKSFRQNVSSLFQDYVKYQLSLRENIGFGQIDKIYDDTVLEEALTKSNMSLDSFSKGLNTQLGTIFNDGVDVSIGQWQKICLSRAFLSNAEFIILDEPTSALDPMTEVEYFDKFSNISSDKTTIFITHRLGVCKFADHILVLKDGELVEQGCHNELINNDGLYSRMYSSQASWYK
jgi:ATP-binding cassette subfamily B protein